jgi:UDP-GlcNAc:undecaprenyl-phosphate GlcNAc-1-phosphate transferase
MLATLTAPLLSFALCLALTPLFRELARRCGLVDRPDGRRKLHGRDTPVAGGLVILLACTISLGTVLVGSRFFEQSEAKAGPSLVGLLIAALIITSLGVIDDLRGMRGRHKLLGQMLAVAAVIAFGVRINSIDLLGWTLDLGPLAVPFTAFVLLGAINSLNLLDGMDGLLSSIGLIICTAFGFMALHGGHEVAAVVAFVLAGALLAFLRYNFPPASIFLGDSGSMLIGLTVGVLAIESCLKASATVALAAPTALLVIPIADTTAAILRRKLTGRSLYTTDRGHLHHCLLRRGLSAQAVLLIVVGCCLITVGGTLASLLLKNELVAVLSAAVVIAILVVSRLFGHAECNLLLQRLQLLMPALPWGQNGPRARELEVRLQGSADWGELWQRIQGCAPVLNLRRVRFDINAPALNEGYHASWELEGGDAEESGLWQVVIPLHVQNRALGQVEVVGYRDAEPIGEKIATLAQMIHSFESTASLLADEAADAAKGVTVHGPRRLSQRRVALAQSGQAN